MFLIAAAAAAAATAVAVVPGGDGGVLPWLDRTDRAFRAKE